MTADERGLEGLDPYDLMDTESARIERWFGQLDEVGLAEASACAGWSRRDVLAHLVATEEYHQACLDGTVSELVGRYVSSGATSLDEINAAGVAAGAKETAADLLAKWRQTNEAGRAGFRAADGTDIDSSIGAYPARAQAFHVAFELAVHADDVGAPMGSDEAGPREKWLAAVAWFALTEVKDDVAVEPAEGGFVVRRGDRRRTFDRGSFVAGVSGRAAPGQLDDPDRELLSLGH